MTVVGPSGRRLRIVIADDHVPTRVSIRQALERADFEICGEAATAAACIEEVRRTAPDLVLVDVRMPGGGIHAAAEIIADRRTTKVVMLTASRRDDDLFAALLCGASGYLLKDTPLDRLPAVIEAVVAGEDALPRALVGRVLAEFRRRKGASRRVRIGRPAATLTEREWEVLELLTDSRSTKDIATRLFVAPVTVRTHVAAIVRKLGVADRESAIAAFEDLRRLDD